MIADSPELGEAGEKHWTRLRAQIELAESFWLGFVFSPSPRSVIILRERAERLLRTQTQTLLLVRPSTPDELRSVLPMLLESPEPVRAGCTWIEAVREDSPGAPEQPWTRAWDELFLRMNERRDALRARLKGGLVFAAPPGIKPRVRDAAPDLWSVRSLVIDLDAMARPGNMARAPSRERASTEESLPAPDPEFALAEAGRRAAKGAEVSQAQALMQATAGLLAEGRIAEANRAAAKARELLRGEGGVAETYALALLAEAEDAAGDPAAAADHFEQAIRSGQRLGEDLAPLEWFDRAGRLALARKDLAAARALYDEAEAIARKRWMHGGKTTESWQNLSVLLTRVGDVRRESGDLAAASLAYKEALALGRQLRELLGNTPEGLRALSVSLDRMGDVNQESGDIVAASAAFGESLALRRRLKELQGDTPEALRDLSGSLDRVGDLSLESGDLTGASAAYEESLALRRRLRELRGDIPEARHDLSLALLRVRKTRRQRDDLVGADAATAEWLALSPDPEPPPKPRPPRKRARKA
jgi:tetratricopeptide (TPR) repeat protein